ncbi:MAG: CBS domain-containing protein [Anaerolineaceae bacterium]|nr:CBS domain-containing protein [Anaerolineaceae bacterium]
MQTVRHILLLKGNVIWSVTPESTAFDAIRLMADKDIGALLVMIGDNLIGIVSERDFARKLILQGKSSKDTQICDVMTKQLFTIHPDQTVHECMEILIENHIRHIPVVEDNKVISVISLGDVVNEIIYQQKESIKSLETQLLNKKS